MVQALALALGSSSSITLFGVSLTSATGALTIAGSLLNTAAGLAISSALAPKPNVPRPENLQVNSKAIAGDRIAHVGRVLVGGNHVFHRAEKGVSYRVVVLGDGEIDGVEEWRLDREAVSLDGAGAVTDDRFQNGGQSRVTVLFRTGQIPEMHYGEITAIWPEWTADHRLDGQWSACVISESLGPADQRKMYPNGEPEITAIARTARFRDPRSAETAWTENAAVIINGWAESRHGLNRADVFDEADIIAAADVCDEAMPLAAGGTEPRFRLSGSYALTEAPQDVMGRMLTACGGRVKLKPNGKLGLQLGSWEEPTVTITFVDLLEVRDYTSGPDLLDRFNTLPAEYTDHGLDYVTVSAEDWVDTDKLAEDGTEMRAQAMSVAMSPSHRQTRSVQKITAARQNPTFTVTLDCKPRALPAAYEWGVMLDIPELGISGPAEVVGHALKIEQGLLQAVTLQLRSFDPDAADLAVDEEGEPQVLPDDTTETGVPTPTGFDAFGAGVRVSSGVFAAGIGVVWDAAPSDALTPLLEYLDESLDAFVDSWVPVAIEADATSALITGLNEARLYSVRLRWIDGTGQRGTAAQETGVVALAAADPPDAPTGLTVTDRTGGEALVEVTASATESNKTTILYRDGVQIAAIDTVAGAAISLVDASGAGTFDWTAKAVNISGIASTTLAGPVTQTIT